MLACPGFPADEEEEEEVVHLLLYIPYYSGSVVPYVFASKYTGTEPSPV